MADKKKFDLSILVSIFAMFVSGIVGYYSGQYGMNEKINSVKTKDTEEINKLKIEFEKIRAEVRINKTNIITLTKR